MNKEKQFNAQIKQLEEDGIIEAVASFETEDRDGDVVMVNGIDLKNFKKNGPVLWSHRADLPAIGRVTKTWVDGKRLMMKILFDKLDPFAAEISRKVKDGFIKALSIGFMFLEAEGQKITKSELLEVSFVNIPANPNATVSREYKSFQAKIKEFETNKIEKMEKGKKEIEKTEEKTEEKVEVKPDISKETPNETAEDKNEAPKEAPNETPKETPKETETSGEDNAGGNKENNKGDNEDVEPKEDTKESPKKKEEDKEASEKEASKKLQTPEDVKNIARITIESCDKTAQALKTLLNNSESTKGEKAEPVNQKVEEPAEAQKHKVVKTTKLIMKALELLLKEIKN